MIKPTTLCYANIRRAYMKIILNPDDKRVSLIKEGLKQKNGYCPCKPLLEKNKCMCQEFKDQIADPNWFGLCYCGLYLKIDDKN